MKYVYLLTITILIIIGASWYFQSKDNDKNEQKVYNEAPKFPPSPPVESN